MFATHLSNKIALLFLFVIGIGPLKAQNIEILFKEIRSTKGQIVVKIYIDDKSFQDDKPIKILKYNKAAMLNKEMSVKFELAAGTYGLALMDDENSNNDMDYGFLGMPDEGFGFSNYYLTGLFKPKFNDFKFTVNKDQKQKVLMKIKYL